MRACHDLSEGGLAVAAAEMAFAGNLGARIFLARVPFGRGIVAELAQDYDPSGTTSNGFDLHPLATSPEAVPVLLFSESNTRFLCEVRPEHAPAFAAAMADVPHAVVGEVTDSGKLEILGIPRLSEQSPGDASGEIIVTTVVQADVAALKQAWQKPLRW